MRTNAIRSKIIEALAIETATANLGTELSRICLQNTGKSPTPETKDKSLGFIRAYIEYVPMLLEQLDKESSLSGIKNEIAPFIKQIEDYFFVEEDIIPDRHGLLGLIDDAYLANSVIAELSKRYNLKVLAALTSDHIAEFNKLIRRVIGNPAGPKLDQKIQEILRQRVTQNLITQLILAAINNSAALNMANYNHPIWGNASTDQIVDAQMGMLGLNRRI